MHTVSGLVFREFIFNMGVFDLIALPDFLNINKYASDAIHENKS